MQFNESDFICDTVDNGVILLDKDLKVYFWNNWLETRTKITSEEIKGKSLEEFYPNLKANTLKRKIKSAFALKSTTFYNTQINQYLLDIKLPSLTNTAFEHMQQNVSITPYDYEKRLVVLYIYDNTAMSEVNHQLRSAKNTLEESVEELELLLNTTMEAIFLFHDEKCVNCNEVALELFSYKNKEEVQNNAILNFVDDTVLFTTKESLENPFEITMKKSNNESFFALIRVKETYFKDRQFKILTVVDITEMKNKDKLLADQSKMAAMGEMIGNIAHQWRQPLSTITMAASGIKYFQERNQLDSKHVIDSMSSIVTQSKHLSQTIDDFRDYLKGDKEKTFFNLKENIKRNLKLIEGMLKNEDITVVFNCEKGIDILNYPNELTQAFLNLVNNSKDAFNEHNEIDERYVFIDAYLQNTSVYLEITDNAKGIDENVIENIFEPYFTTKHQSLGTGLGLYMTHQIITLSMKGSIYVKNRAYRYNNQNYKGACFVIELPL